MAKCLLPSRTLESGAEDLLKKRFSPRAKRKLNAS